MKSSSRITGWIAGTLFLFMVAFALTGPGGRGGSDVDGSIDAAHDDGRRALALVLARLGLAAEGWRRAPAALPEGGHVAWMASDHTARGSSRAGRRDAMPSVGMHAPEHYAEFVARGGTLVVEGHEGLAFLRDRMELEEALGLDLTSLDHGVHEVRLQTGEVLRVATSRAFEPPESGSHAREFAVVSDADGVELAFAVELLVGSGRVIAVADGDVFDNARVGESEHALLAVRIAEDARPGARVLFDEYALGLWSQGGPMSVAARPAIVLFCLNAALLGLLWTWMRAAPRAFPRDPEPLDTFSPVLRARAQARLHERAGRAELFAPAARAAAYDRIAARRRIGRRRETGSSELDVARLVADLERASAGLGARALDVLRTRRVAARADLEALTRDLARLEDDVRALDPEGRGDRGAKP